MSKPQVDAADRWLLQIKGQIVGPMPAEKILVRLLNGEITVMSRVSQDRTSWRAICNTPAFEELVNERIRAYSGKSEIVGQFGPNHHDDTPFETSEVNFSILKTDAVEGISEQLDHARQLEELTANIQKLNHLRKEIIQNKRTVTVEKDDEDDSDHPEDQNIFIPKTKKSTGLTQFFARLKSGDVQSRRFAIGSLVLIVGGLVSSLVYYGIESYTSQQEVTEAATNPDPGYADAAAQLDKEKGLTPPNPEELLQLADDHLKGKRPIESQALSRQVLNMNASKEVQAKAHALVAAAAMQMGETEVAISEYARAIEVHEMHSSLHNLGVLQLKAGKAAEAERYLIKAVQVAAPHSAPRSISLLALFEAARTIDESATNASEANHLSAVSPFIEDELKAAQALRPRLLLARLYIEHAKATRMNLLPIAQSGFQLAAVEFVDHPLELTAQDDVLLNGQLDEQFSSWQGLVHRCAGIYKQPPVNSFTAAIYAACLSRSHGAASALPLAKYASELNATDPIFGGLYAALLVQTKNQEAAKALLAAHPEFADLSKQAKLAASELRNSEPATPEPTTPEPTSDERLPATAD